MCLDLGECHSGYHQEHNRRTDRLCKLVQVTSAPPIATPGQSAVRSGIRSGFLLYSDRRGSAWVRNFTYVASWKGFAYFAFVPDALEQAVLDCRPAKGMGLVHHGDRGTQYLSIRYCGPPAEAGIEPSVGSVGDSYDYALARRSTVCSRPRSSIDADLGTASSPWNTPPMDAALP